MITNAVAKQVRHREWAQAVYECRSSNMKVGEWCAANGINKSSYYYRLSQVREAVLLSGGKQEIVEIPYNRGTGKENRLEARYENHIFTGGLSVSIGSAIIHVNTETAPQVLKMVMEVLGHVE
jgi:hypothetical protein